MEGIATHDRGRAALVLSFGNPDGTHASRMFHLALRQTECLIGSIIGLLGLDLAVPDHSTLSRRAATLEVPRPQARRDGAPLHLPLRSTSLKLCGAGEWLVDALNRMLKLRRPISVRIA